MLKLMIGMLFICAVFTGCTTYENENNFHGPAPHFKGGGPRPGSGLRNPGRPGPGGPGAHRGVPNPGPNRFPR